jgi:hypothetical protein
MPRSLKLEPDGGSMPFKYWRTVICASALGVCGLAVWADDSLRSSRKTGALPSAADPAPEPPKAVVEVAPPVVPPMLDVQFEKAAVTKNEPVALTPPQSSDEPPPLPPGFKLPPDLPKPNSKPELPAKNPPPVFADSPKPPAFDVPKPVDNPEPKQPSVTGVPPFVDAPDPYHVPPAPPLAQAFAGVDRTPTPAPTVAITQLTPRTAGQFKMCLRMGGTDQPRFEIMDKDIPLLKVQCERIELRSDQGVTAMGQVRLHGSGLDGTCDQLAISCTTCEVELKGNVKLNCYRGGASSQVSAEQMKFQLKGTGEVSSSGVKAIKTSVVPAAEWSPKR